MGKHRRNDNAEEIIDGDGQGDVRIKKKKNQKQIGEDNLTDVEITIQISHEKHHSKKKQKRRANEENGEMCNLSLSGDSNQSNDIEPIAVKKKKKRHHDDHEDVDSAHKEEDNVNKDADLSVHKKKKRDKKEKTDDALEETQVSTKSTSGLEMANMDGDLSIHKKKKKDKKKKMNDTLEETQVSAKSTSGLEMANMDGDLSVHKKKKRDKKEKTDDALEETQVSTKSTSGLEYLCKWEKDKPNWKFQTMRQVWLLQHLYDSELIPEDHFGTLLEYIDSIKGKSREITLKKAQDMMKLHEQAEGVNVSENEGSDEGKKDEDVEKALAAGGQQKTKEESSKGKLLPDDVYERVRQVIQLLL